KMPNLERLAVINRWSLMVAFLLLTLSFGTGVGLIFFPRHANEGMSFSDPLVIVGGVMWGALAAIFVWVLRHRRPTGKQMICLTLCTLGFLLMMVGVLIVSRN